MKTDDRIDPLGNAVGVGCHNCRQLDDEADVCQVRLMLYDDGERISDENGNYVLRLRDYCPDWESAYVSGFTVANLRANRSRR
jgi:hypothetical protein